MDKSEKMTVAFLPESKVLDHLMACGEMVPAQQVSPTGWTPEKKLAAAVLANTLVNVRDRSGDPAFRKSIREDLEWIASTETEWPFSFERLCQLFELNADWVRGVVDRWVAAPEKRPRRMFSAHRHAA